jgi:MFS family permease
LIVPEFNVTLALICRQRYSTPSLAQETSADLLSELSQCGGNKNAQSDLSHFFIYGQSISGILGAMSTPIMGSLSDRLGRKQILACSVFGPLLADIIVILTLRYPDEVDMRWLLLGYAFDGLCGSVMSATAASQAYVSDITSPETRATGFSYLQAAFTCALAFGPLVSGGLLSMLGSLLTVYYVALAIHLSLLIIFLFVLPESCRQESVPSETQEGHTDSPRLGIFRRVFNLFSSLGSLYPTGPGSSPTLRTNIAILALLEVTNFGVQMGLTPLQLAYSAYVFQWHAASQSLYLAIVNSWKILLLIALFPLVMSYVRRQKPQQDPKVSSCDSYDVTAIRVSLLSELVGYIGVSLSQSPTFFIISSLVGAFGSPGTPLLTSSLTRHVSEESSGRLLGALSFLHAISRTLIPAALNTTYSMSVGIYSQALFVILAVVYGLALVASLALKPIGG